MLLCGPDATSHCRHGPGVLRGLILAVWTATVRLSLFGTRRRRPGWLAFSGTPSTAMPMEGISTKNCSSSRKAREGAHIRMAVEGKTGMFIAVDDVSTGILAVLETDNPAGSRTAAALREYLNCLTVSNGGGQRSRQRRSHMGVPSIQATSTLPVALQGSSPRSVKRSLHLHAWIVPKEKSLLKQGDGVPRCFVACRTSDMRSRSRGSRNFRFRCGVPCPGFPGWLNGRPSVGFVESTTLVSSAFLLRSD